MPNDRSNDLLAFRSFVDRKLAGGEAALTLDEVLGLWEYENASEAEREEALEAVRSGLEDMHAGRVRPAEVVLHELQRRLQLPKPS